MAHFLVTGHTGFKGSWLTLLLKARGHEVSGVALEPPDESLFVEASIQDELVHDLRVDIRDRESTVAAVKRVSPDFVIHMAAQALVREGYRRPVETYETNVTGSLNVLHSVALVSSVRAQIIVTSDKVYKDTGLNRPYVESDSLGGKDPYSASKAMADILAQQWLGNSGAIPGAIARAGNVIGAGDFSHERLIPDVLRNIQNGSKLSIRYPKAVRPWQHVLDCLDGYLLLLHKVDSKGVRGAWNFGPEGEDFRSVEQLLEAVESEIGGPLKRERSVESELKEDSFLALDSTKAREELSWNPKIAFQRAVTMTLEAATSAGTASLGTTVRAQVLRHVGLDSGPGSTWR